MRHPFGASTRDFAKIAAPLAAAKRGSTNPSFLHRRQERIRTQRVSENLQELIISGRITDQDQLRYIIFPVDTNSAGWDESFDHL